ncbi:HpcH/HpaI aldolase family protein [Pseudomonas sp. TH31]|uniref:HpcH/HpaI aldolase family protein n=1 Tax=Pseudomonas sp. TH31 TaxID=2796396 RepID=UPI001912F7B3|nr:aldolase/citrate lyase family protein [Pseudomonas sp. TH31]MBK5416074.1 hypothetical protein [Pseudomonas sp. TH31]
MSSLKQRLAEGRSLLMVNPNHVSSTLAEKLTASGADAIFIDCEHGAADFQQVQLMAKGARLGGGFTIVRPQNQERSVITRCLNCGADGVMVPLVHTAAKARAVVETVRYACPDTFADKLVIVMIESLEAVDNLDEILTVEGIDVFFVGPGDLSQSMGYSPAVAAGDAGPSQCWIWWMRRWHAYGLRVVGRAPWRCARMSNIWSVAGRSCSITTPIPSSPKG